MALSNDAVEKELKSDDRLRGKGQQRLMPRSEHMKIDSKIWKKIKGG
jgi:hypothetical protein